MKLETRLSKIEMDIRNNNIFEMETVLRKYVMPSLDSLIEVKRIVGINGMSEEMKEAINTLESLKTRIIDKVYFTEDNDYNETYVIDSILEHKGETLNYEEQQELLDFIREQTNRKYPSYNWRACGLNAWLYYLGIDHYKNEKGEIVLDNQFEEIMRKFGGNRVLPF